MAEPRCIVWLDEGEVSVEPADRRTSLEGYEAAEVEVISSSGQRLRTALANAQVWDEVSFIPTGELEPDHLAGVLHGYVERTDVRLDGTGDFLIDAAKAIEASELRGCWRATATRYVNTPVGMSTIGSPTKTIRRTI